MIGLGTVINSVSIVAGGVIGHFTLLARLVAPIMTSTALAYLSLIGSVLIFCIGVNLVWGKKLKVANMLPAVILAILAAYLPWDF